MSVTMVGVDPGGRYTGVITRSSAGVTACRVLTRTTGGDLPDDTYIHQVLDEVSKQMEHAEGIALEGIVVPRGRNPQGDKVHMTMAGLIGTAMVYGAVVARWPRVVIVPPGDNGALPEFAYPNELRKRARLGGPSNHARSAFDVARVGELLYRATRIPRGGTAK